LEIFTKGGRETKLKIFLSIATTPRVDVRLLQESMDDCDHCLSIVKERKYIVIAVKLGVKNNGKRM
jgi:hypothetical protein